MNITVYCVGKIKEDFYRAAVGEYEKRLSRYCKLRIVEVPDEKTPDRASAALKTQIKDKEGQRLLAKIKDTSYLIALAIDGKKMDSVSFSDKMADLGLCGTSDIGFVIGGSLGLSDAVIRRADMRLSFSDMTFPHQLMRVILLEQIYRAYKIRLHEPYHK
ncbi:MAG: 23S rRNA (pseudouridine(1915)-N(3))-methyltransferase RlmH [Clostridiales bacterium]|nr:23S rRNA (pseudouridine(1915)-N(3))-methyltransferase RlmH [Clostridiales bacterium]